MSEEYRGRYDRPSKSTRRLGPLDLTILQLTEYVDNWIRDNHVPFPRAGEPELTLMEEKALREEAERAVSLPSAR